MGRMLHVLSILVWSSLALANPSGINVSGKIVLQSTNGALSSSSVNFRIHVLSPAPENCVLYTERFNSLDLGSSGGVFNITLGKGVFVFNAFGGTNTKSDLINVFSNSSAALTGGTLAPYGIGTCTGGNYAPADGDVRQIVIEFDPAGGTSFTALSPYHQIRSVPYAMLADKAIDADKLGGTDAADYAKTADLPAAVTANETDPAVTGIGDCGVGQVLTKTGGVLTCVTDNSGGAPAVATDTTTGVVMTGNAATTGIAVAGDGTISISNTVLTNISDAQTDITDLQNDKVDKAAMAVCGTNQVLVWQSPGDNFLCSNIAITASQVTDFNTAADARIAADTTKLATAGGTMTGAITMSGAGSDINMGNNLITNVGYLHFENKAADPVFNAANNGYVWYNATDGKLKFNDGTAIREISIGGSISSGDIADDSIVDADINSAAAITRSKLASGTANRILVNNGSGVMVDAAAINPNVVLISDANGIPTHSAVTATELGYVSGVTSAIQTQLDTLSTGVAGSVQNGAGTPSITTDVIASRPAAGTAGRLFIASDENKMYRDNGATWDQIGDGTGAGGTVTDVSSANADISVATGTTTPVLTLNTGTGANQIVKLDGSGNLPAVDGSALTNLDVANIASGATKYFTYAPNGVACSDGEILKKTANGWECAADAGAGGADASSLQGSAISVTAPSANQFLQWSGTAWTPWGFPTCGTNSTLQVDALGNISCAAISGIVNANIDAAAAVDRSKLANGTANRVVVNDGTGVMVDAAAINANVALVSDANGIPTHSAVTATELGYVSGVTSAIQTQLDNLGTAAGDKVAKAGDTMTGDLVMSNESEVRFGDSGAKYIGLKSPASVTGSSMTFTLPDGDGSANQVLQTDGSGVLSWANQTAAPGDASYAAKGVVQFDTDAATSGVNVAAGVASINAGTAGGAGDANKIAKLDGSGVLANNMIPNLDWSKITSGTPTTLSGYGITDAVQNAAGTPSITTDVIASRPAAGTAGRIFIASDENKIYRDNGATWDELGDGTGAGGTVTDVSSANTDISVATGTSTPVLTLNSGTTGGAGDADKIAKLDGSGLLAPAMIPNIEVDKITSAAGKYLTYAPNGVACTNGEILKKTANGWECAADAGAGGADASSLQGSAISVTAPSANQFLQWSGTAWTPWGFPTCGTNSTLQVDALGNISCAAISGIVNANIDAAAAIDRSKLANGTANRILVNDGSGVMADAAAINANVALISDANGIPTHSAVTATELGYVSGVTSGIQGQIDALSTADTGKVAKAGDTMTGNLTMSNETEVRLGDSGSNYVGFKAPGTVTTSTTFTLPDGDGSANQVLQTDGSGVLSWANQTAAPGDSSYAAKGVVQFDTDAATSGINVASGVASVNAGTAGGAGDANKIAKLNGSGELASNMIPSLDWSKITSGTPTTLGGYGITDAVQNGAGTPSITTDVIASRPAAGTAGRIFIASDENKMYRDNGATWDELGDGTGAGGTVTDVSSANADISVATGTTTPVLTLNTGTGANQIVKLDGSGNLPAVDGSALTNLDVANIASGAGKYFTYAPNGAACTNGEILKKTANGWECAADAGAGGADASSLQGSAISVTAPSANQFLQWSGTAWTPWGFPTCGTNSTLQVDALGNISCAAISGIVNANIDAAAAIDRSKLASGTANRVVVNDGTGVMVDAAAINANVALISDANGIPTHSAVTATELGYVSGVTSAIQTQLDNLGTTAGDKVAKAGDAMTGALTMNAENEVRFADTDSSNYVGFKAPGTVGTNRIWTLPAADGSANQVLQTDGSGALSWANQTAAPGDASYAAKGVVQFDTDAATSGVNVAAGVASVNAGTAGGAGDANKIAKLDGSGVLATAMIPNLDWAKITSGTPTTLSGYGITDAVQNGAGTPSITTDVIASRPAAGTAGRIFIASDESKIYRDNGATWDELGDGTGAGGTVTNVSSANTDIAVATGTTTPVLTLNTGTGADQIVKLDGSARLPAVDGSALTNLDVADITSGAGKYFTYAPNGAACTNGEILKKTANGWECAADAGAGGADASSLQGSAISVTAPSANQFLQWSGTAWTPWGFPTCGTNSTLQVDALGNVSCAAISGIVNANIDAAAAIDRSKLASGTANRIVVNDGSGVMADAAAINANVALISDANGIPTHSAVTATELGYVSGVTSGIQGQIDALSTADTNKVAKAGDSMTGALTMNAENEVRFADTDSSNYVGFKAPGTVGTNRIWTLPAADGSANQVLQTDGSGVLSWANQTAAPGDSSYAAKGVVQFDTDAATSGINVASGVASVNAGTAGGAGDANKIAKLDGSGVLANNMIPNLDWSKITSGTPTTLSGYGITDAVQNGAGTPSITTDVIASRPAAGTAGRIFIASDESKIYRDNGSGWDLLSDGAGTGTVSNVSSANSDISVATGSSTPVLTLNSGTAGGAGDANKIAKLDGSGVLATAMIPGLDAAKITSGQFGDARISDVGVDKISSDTGKYFSYMPNGTECADGEILKWVAASDQWVCGTAADLGAITSVVAGNGIDVNTVGGAATVSVEAELNALNGLATTGFVQRTGAATYSTLTGNVAASNDTVVVRNGSGVSGFYGVDLSGATSGAVTMMAPAVTTSYTMTLPATAGTNGYVLQTDGSGTTSWVAQSSGADNLGNHTATTNIQLGSNWLSGDGGNEGIYVDSAGKVGIGTSTLSSALTVNGNATVNGISVGTGPSNGTYSVAIGLNALTANTMDGGNVAVGPLALTTLTTAQDNTAVGMEALRDNDGNKNTAVGAYALNYTSFADENSAFGWSALGANTTGSYNTALGYGAGSFTKTGNNNTLVGHSAGYGLANNSYSNNTVVGTLSGYALRTGSNNTLLGYRAADNLTTGGNNIVIGYDIDAPTATSANVLNIGNLIFGTGLDGTGTTLSTGNIGIGTTTPGAKLDVKGAIRMSGSASGYTGFQPAAAAGSTVWTLPAADGSNGQVLTTNGAGILSWSTSAAPADASYAAKGIVQFDTDATTSGMTVASGVASVNKTTTAEASKIMQLDASGRSVTKGNIINGTTSGALTLMANASTTDYTLTFPAAQGGSGQVLTNNGSGVLSWSTPSSTPGDAGYGSGNKGIVAFLTDAATSGISVTAGVANVNTGTGANQIVKLDGSGNLPAVNGSALTNLNASNISSGTLGVARGGTGSTTFTANGLVMAGATGTSPLASITCAATGRALEWTGTTWGCSADFMTSGSPGSKVNYVLLTGSTTGNAVSLAAAGSDTNVTLALTGKGTGYVQTNTTLNVNATYIERVPAAASNTHTITADRNIHRVALTANSTITLPATPSPANSAFSLTVKVKQDATGSRTITWATGSGTLKWDSGAAPDPATGANQETIYQFLYLADDATWYGMQVWKEQ